MRLDIDLNDTPPARRAPADPAGTAGTAGTALTPLDLVDHRLSFAAWPQARAHDSWLQALGRACGLTVSPAWGVSAGPAARAVADALLTEAGATPAIAAQPVPVDRLPAWALQPLPRLQRQLSTAGALNLLPELRAAVRGDAIRHWDAVLGPDVRRTTLRWCVQNLKVEAPPHARALRSQIQTAARSADGWQRFCQAMALTALADLGDAVLLRMRLIWPHGQRDVAALSLEPAAMRWLHTCVKVADVMLADLASDEAAQDTLPAAAAHPALPMPPWPSWPPLPLPPGPPRAGLPS